MKNRTLQEILDLLDLEKIEENLFRGQNHQTEHVFGGQVLAQALISSHRTVNPDHYLHSLHSYFLRPGDWKTPILYEVDRIREGKSFTTRRVSAIQKGKAIFTLSCSWQKEEPGLDHEQPMPDVPPPESLRGDLEAYQSFYQKYPEVKRFSFRFEAIESKAVEKILMHEQSEHAPVKHTWLRTREPSPMIHRPILPCSRTCLILTLCPLPCCRIATKLDGGTLWEQVWTTLSGFTVRSERMNGYCLPNILPMHMELEDS